MMCTHARAKNTMYACCEFFCRKHSNDKDNIKTTKKTSDGYNLSEKEQEKAKTGKPNKEKDREKKVDILS